MNRKQVQVSLKPFTIHTKEHYAWYYEVSTVSLCPRLPVHQFFPALLVLPGRSDPSGLLLSPSAATPAGSPEEARCPDTIHHVYRVT